MRGSSPARMQIFEYQTPELISQAAPVNGTWYPAVPTVLENARIYRIAVNVATANETMECRLIIDGETVAGVGNAATAGTSYCVYWYPTSLADQVAMNDSFETFGRTGFLVDGKSIEVQIRKTTATGAGTITACIIWGQLSRV